MQHFSPQQLRCLAHLAVFWLCVQYSYLYYSFHDGPHGTGRYLTHGRRRRKAGVVSTPYILLYMVFRAHSLDGVFGGVPQGVDLHSGRTTHNPCRSSVVLPRPRLPRQCQVSERGGACLHHSASPSRRPIFCCWRDATLEVRLAKSY